MGTLGRAICAAGNSIRGTGRLIGRLGSTIQGAEEQVSRQRRTVMSIFEKEPRIKKDVFVAPSAAAVTGDVEIRHGSSICRGSVLRGLSKQTTIGGLREAFLKSGEATHVSSLKNSRWYMINSNRSGSLAARKECCKVLPSSVRPSASYSTQASENKPKQERTDLTTIEDPFDAPTYNIPEKPVTFVEGASYSVAILAGLGVAALAGYAVFKELIFEPKEYKIFGKVLARVQSDSQVTAKIGYPITGYGAESRNRAARQRIPNRVWTDEDGVEHVEVNFHVRGPHGAGKVFAEMFKDSSDRTWKFTFLVVEITSPRHAQMMLESYVPA